MAKKALQVYVDLSKKNLGISRTTLKKIVNRATRSVIATGDKKAINNAVKTAIKIGSNSNLSKSVRSRIDKLLADAGRLKKIQTGTNKGKWRVTISGGSGNKNTFNFTNSNIQNRTLEKLKNVGVLSNRTIKNLKNGIKNKKDKKTKLNKNNEAIKSLLEIIESMGGITIALDKYLDDIERLAANAGVSMDELIDAF